MTIIAHFVFGRVKSVDFRIGIAVYYVAFSVVSRCYHHRKQGPERRYSLYFKAFVN